MRDQLMKTPNLDSNKFRSNSHTIFAGKSEGNLEIFETTIKTLRIISYHIFSLSSNLICPLITYTYKTLITQHFNDFKFQLSK